MTSRSLILLLAANVCVLAVTLFLLFGPATSRTPSAEPSAQKIAGPARAAEAFPDDHAFPSYRRTDAADAGGKTTIAPSPQSGNGNYGAQANAPAFSAARLPSTLAPPGPSLQLYPATSGAPRAVPSAQNIGEPATAAEANPPDSPQLYARNSATALAGGNTIITPRTAPDPQSGNGSNGAQADSPAVGAAQLPSALAPQDPSLQSNDRQAAALQQIQQQFAAAMAGGNQDPSSPEYLQRWQQAQWQSDQLYLQQFGSDAYNLQQIKAKAAQNSQ